MELRNLIGAAMVCFGLLTAPALAENPWEVMVDPAALPSPAASGRVATEGGESVYFEIHGTQGPWIIFLHGGTGSALSFGNQVPDFAAHNRVLLIESRGHGRSSWNGEDLHYDRMAEDVIRVMDALAIDKADLVGWSDGGDIALIMAITHPERVAKFVTTGANADTDAYDMENLQKPPYSVPNDRSERAYKAISPTPERWDAFKAAVYAMWEREPHILNDLGRIKAPALIVVGQYDAISVAHTEDIASRIPGAKAVVIPDASHYLPIQAPEVFNPLVKDFLGVE